MDKDDKEIEGQLSLALCELDKAYEYIFKKEYCDSKRFSGLYFFRPARFGEIQRGFSLCQ